MVTLLAVGTTPLVVRLGILRVESNGLGVVCDGLVELTILRISIGPPTIDFGMSWIEPNGLREVRNRPVESPFFS